MTQIRKDVWRLDLLGNWVGAGGDGGGGDPGGPGREVVAGPMAAATGEWLDPGHHTAKVDEVNARNALTGITTGGGPSGGAQVHPRYDAAGNLAFDGEYFYQYDAWNRLVQVNRGHEGPPPPPQTGGQPTGDPDEPVPGAPIIIDQLVKHWTYDGLGRLVRTQSPWPDPDIGVATGVLRSERFYYDGIRRIQEVVTDPVASQGVIQQSGAQMAGGPEDPNADPTAAAITTEQQQINGQAGGSGAPPPALPQTVTTLVREYVWGPGDGPGGVDELLVQFAGSDRGKPWWVLQDGGGDVAALVETPLAGAQAVVAGQWTYDAYGSCLTADVLRPHPLMHCGHKALFFDRLDVGVVGSSGDELPRLVPYAHAVYQVRNRAYAPALGRFYQRDPNATAMALIEVTAYHGRGLDAIVAAFSMGAMYGDGANLYEYLGSNPWRRHDHLGLSDDPFDMVDDYLAESSANAAAFMESVSRGFDTLVSVAWQLAQFYPPIGMAMMACQIANGEFELWDLLYLLPLGRTAEKLMTAIGYFDVASDVYGLIEGDSAGAEITVEDRPEFGAGAALDDGAGGPAMAGEVTSPPGGPGQVIPYPKHHENAPRPGASPEPRDARMRYQSAVAEKGGDLTRWYAESGRGTIYIYKYDPNTGHAHWTQEVQATETSKVPAFISKHLGLRFKGKSSLSGHRGGRRR